MAESLTPVHLLKKYDTGDNPGAANLNSNLDTIERDLISWGTVFPSTFTLQKLFLKTDEGKFYQNTGTLEVPVWTFVTGGAGGGGGAGWKAKVRVATAAAGTLSTSFAAGQTVDGIVLAEGDRILIKDQADESENGIYEVQAAGAPARASDADTSELLDGAVVVVGLGTAGANTVWQQNTDDPVVDTDDIEWAELGSGGATSWKAKVRVATNIDGVLATDFAAGQSVDGVVLAEGDRILIKDQIDNTENGIYIVQAAGAPLRASDADTTARMDGAVVVVGTGGANLDTIWQQITDNPTIGVDSILWTALGVVYDPMHDPSFWLLMG